MKLKNTNREYYKVKKTWECWYLVNKTKLWTYNIVIYSYPVKRWVYMINKKPCDLERIENIPEYIQ